MQATEKLQKVLARSGHGSRRAIEQMIREGRIRVNGQVAFIGDRISADADVRVDGHKVTITIAEDIPCRVIVYNKPEGQLVTRHDPEGRETVYSHLPPVSGARWIAIGRLDMNTSGLILFTTDGELANRLMHPKYEVEREYAVRVFGEVNDGMIQRLRQGVQLEDGPAQFTKFKKGGGEGINRWYNVTLMEGRNRQVRRMWESQGVEVSRLIRIRMGEYQLPKGLVQGGWLDLTLQEVNYLRRLAQLKELESAPVITKDDRERQLRKARRGSRRRRERS